MRKGAVLILAILAAIAAAGGARAGQIWTDGDGDGLPDAQALAVVPGTDVTLGVWVDAQSFSWTNFLAYVEWAPGCFEFQSASYVVSGGSTFPIDDFSHPSGVGFGGSGFSEGGVDWIGNVTLRVVVPTPCAVTPIIDIDNPFYVFSQLGAGSAYQLFTTSAGTSYGGDADPPLGACCFVDRSCAALDANACAAAGGVFMGDFTECGQVSCGPPFVGACCLPNGTCQILIESDCVAVGGAYAGNDVACADANCPASEACCFCPNGSCEDLTPEACSAAGGVSYGPGSSCASPPVCDCPPPLGACCFADGSCADYIAEADCIASGGAAFTPGISCSEAQCIPPNGVEPRTWGRIKSLFR